MRRVVDLSVPMRVEDPRGTLRLEPYRTLAKDRANITLVTFDSHFSTHLEAPSHQLANAPTLETVDLKTCVGKATVLNLSEKKAGSQIDRADLERFTALVIPGARLLLRTDWNECYGKPDHNEGYPALTVAAAAWLAERGVSLVGVDMPSVAPVYEGMEITNAVHAPLLKAGVVLVENLCRLKEVPAGPFTFIALPLHLIGLDGCPVRAVAVIDDERTAR